MHKWKLLSIYIKCIVLFLLIRPEQNARYSYFLHTCWHFSKSIDLYMHLCLHTYIYICTYIYTYEYIYIYIRVFTVLLFTSIFLEKTGHKGLNNIISAYDDRTTCMLIHLYTLVFIYVYTYIRISNSFFIFSLVFF
jgi:hypothetical protein